MEQQLIDSAKEIINKHIRWNDGLGINSNKDSLLVIQLDNYKGLIGKKLTFDPIAKDLSDIGLILENYNLSIIQGIGYINFVINIKEKT